MTLFKFDRIYPLIFGFSFKGKNTTALCSFKVIEQD